MEKHVYHFKPVFDVRLCECLFSNFKKYSFGVDKVVFLGFVFSANRIEVNEIRWSWVMYLVQIGLRSMREGGVNQKMSILKQRNRVKKFSWVCKFLSTICEGI